MCSERDMQIANKNPIIFCCGSEGCSLKSLRDKEWFYCLSSLQFQQKICLSRNYLSYKKDGRIFVLELSGTVLFVYLGDYDYYYY